jgi:hypothetical protein
LGIDNGGSPIFYARNTAGVIADYACVNGVIDINVWNHVAVARSGNIFAIFLNGKNVTPTSPIAAIGTAEMPDIAGAFEIGRRGSGSRYFSGWIDELRVTKGSSRGYILSQKNSTILNSYITGGLISGTTISGLTSDVGVADGGTGVSSLTAYAVLCGGTTSTGPIQSIASVGTAGQLLTSNGAGALPTFQSLGASSLPTGIVLQSVTVVDGAAYNNNNTYTLDDTVPTNTMGAEITGIAVTITPKSTTSKLLIIFSGFFAMDSGGPVAVAAFRDSTSAAVGSTVTYCNASTSYYATACIKTQVTSGSLSATTFKIRYASCSGGNKASVNSKYNDFTRYLGGNSATSLTVMEVSA